MSPSLKKQATTTSTNSTVMEPHDVDSVAHHNHHHDSIIPIASQSIITESSMIDNSTTINQTPTIKQQQQQHATVLRRSTNSSIERLASSEEESVAEIGYFSETSNASVSPSNAMHETDTNNNIILDQGIFPHRDNINEVHQDMNMNNNNNDNDDQQNTTIQMIRSTTNSKSKSIKNVTTTTTSISSPKSRQQLLQQQQQQRNSSLSSSYTLSQTAINSVYNDVQQQRLNNHLHEYDNNDSKNNHHSNSQDEYLNIDNGNNQDHDPCCPNTIPKFRDIHTCMWMSSWAANCPTEDRSASLVNLLLQPLPPNYDSETQLAPLEIDYKTLIRLNLWAVIDGHGGGCVATYSSEVLLPHIAASISRALNCAIIDRGVCTVNGQMRDANALDLDGLIKTSDRSHGGNPNSIHYRSPYERSDSEDDDHGIVEDEDEEDIVPVVPHTIRERKQIASLVAGGALNQDIPDKQQQQRHRVSKDTSRECDAATVSSVKTSVKTAASLVNREELVGTHSPQEVAAITRAITESFLAVDEGWINSIDPIATQQTSCQNNGRWNSGACALVVFTIQRLDWTNVVEPEREKEMRGIVASRLNTSQNRDAARRRMLDFAQRSKSASSVSTASSTSSMTTEEAVNASGIESEITETEGEDDDQLLDTDIRKRITTPTNTRSKSYNKTTLTNPSTGSSSYGYKAHGAMIYTAHVGDCRAVLLGSAPPRTIKVGGSGLSSLSHQDTTDDEESSNHSSDETECLSSSDHEADSSEDDDIGIVTGSIPISPGITSTATTTTTTTSTFRNVPRRVVRQRNDRTRTSDDTSGPYVALPPLETNEETKLVDFDIETDIDRGDFRSKSVVNGTRDPSDSSSCSQDSIELIPLVQLPPGTSPIDLTTDHSAYNPAEVTAVLRRCNNAPRAISAGVGGGIKRVAGSLAVTRALGDAYLKTPLLSFLPYKSHAPYISARPEVNCRPLVNDGDKVLVLATDGVWERASGEDVLRWVRNFYEERIAEIERRKRRMNQTADRSQLSENDDIDDDDDSFEPVPVNKNFIQEGSERDLFEKNDPDMNQLSNVTAMSSSTRKRDISTTSSPGVTVTASTPSKRRKRNHRQSRWLESRITYNVADVIIRRVLNKVRRSRNISSLQALMSLPQGRARRSKHDDITASVVDLSAFVS